MIKVLLVDDAKLFREAIKNVLDHDDDIDVVACASNGSEAMALCDKHLPDLVLMDIIMPIENGVESTKHIKEKYNWIKVIMLTSSVDDETIRSALKNGADGYVLKDVNPNELILSIKSVMSGLSIIDKNIYKMVTEQMKMNTPDVELPDVDLTEKELEIIKLIADGKNNKEIAADLFLAPGRVKNIITGILQKLQLKDRTQIAVFAVKKGLV